MRAIDYIWLIPLFPLVAAGLQAFLKRPQKRVSMFLSIAAMTAALVVSLWAFKDTLGGGHHDEPAKPNGKEMPAGSHAAEVRNGGAKLKPAPEYEELAKKSEHVTYRATHNFPWITMGAHDLKLGFVNDPMTAIMLVMVTFVGLMIFIFSTGYMGEDENATRFFCFLSLFAASMLGLVVSNNLLMLFMCWELVGLCSYLLIGFWYFKPSAAEAMKKAFITTRIGDIGFFIGILWLYAKSGTLLFYDNGAGILEDANVAKLAAENMSFFGVYMSVSSAIAICLFIGAMGKSAQFPLHVWLPDAMEGPTPVSALIHAATMVAAGVFMVGRMYPIFDASIVDGQLVHAMTQAHPHPTPALTFVMWVGAITAVFAATIGVAQNDVKRVLAYSTCSQLGFMMMGLGAVGFVAGMFHLITHAFFKALLFLGSGAVIHGCHHEQDMARMGGLKKLMPITFVVYLIGMLALVGAPLTSGFFSKDEILLAAFHTNRIVFAMGVFGAFLTAFYMTRQMYMVFAGEYRGGDLHGHDAHAHEKHGAQAGTPVPPDDGHGEHDKRDDHGHSHGGMPHEVPKHMWMPLAALAVFALLLGFLGTPFIGGNLWHHYLAPESAAHDVNWMVMGIATGAGLIGFLLSRAIYGKRAVLADGSDPLQSKLGGVWTLLNNKWYVDEIYGATVVRVNWICAALFRGVDASIDWTLHAISWVTIGISSIWRWVGDEFLINGGVDTVSEGVRGTGSGFSSVQSGKVQNYLRIVGWGAVGLVLVVLFLTREHWEHWLSK